MAHIVCTQCGTKNRVVRFRIGAKATGGGCGASLSELIWVRLARTIKKYAIPIALLASFGIYYGYGKAHTPEVVGSNYVPVSTVSETPVSTDSSRDITSSPTEAPPQQCTPVTITHGVRERYTKKRAVAPFRLETNPGGSYFIVLIDDSTDRTFLPAYTSGGSPLEMKVPVGIYRINYAFGDMPWCGEIKLFGEGTETATTDDKFIFSDTGSQYEGHVISLIRQVNGNLTTTSISPKNLFGAGKQSDLKQ